MWAKKGPLYKHSTTVDTTVLNYWGLIDGDKYEDYERREIRNYPTLFVDTYRKLCMFNAIL